MKTTGVCSLACLNIFYAKLCSEFKSLNIGIIVFFGPSTEMLPLSQ